MDGFGILHPRSCGSASHLGVVTGMPTIGVAKALLHIPDLSEKEVRLQMGHRQLLASCGFQQQLGPRGSIQKLSVVEATRHMQGTSRDSCLADGDYIRPPDVHAEASHRNYSNDEQVWQGLDSQHLQMGTGLSCAANAMTHPLVSNGKLVGMALCATPHIKRPVYVSVGNGISLASAVSLVHRCSRYRWGCPPAAMIDLASFSSVNNSCPYLTVAGSTQSHYMTCSVTKVLLKQPCGITYTICHSICPCMSPPPPSTNSPDSMTS